tara:strand:+ start:2259 stop:3848 length:1590 start_codon:yes stop_codon:yes gene_type:complete
MSFLRGLITGAATSIDDQLKKDMERSQERAEGMAQYRITRRRAEIERQEKEKRELKETLGNLATLVDGDVDKAAQLYKAGGGNIAGANALFTELKKNADAGKDINTAITFAEARAEPGQMTDYINQFITPISKLPPVAGVKGAGLYGAMFKPDLSARVQEQVDEAAPLPAQEARDMDVQMATIDRTGFLAAQEAQREEKRFELEVAAAGRDATLDDINQKRLRQAMDIAKAAEERAGKQFASDAEQREVENARAEVEALQRQARLIQEAEAHVLAMRKDKLNIKKTELEIAKEEDHPQFKDFEDQAVYAAQKLAMADLTEEEREDYQKLYDSAIEGAVAYANATETKASGTAANAVFSKQSLDSIVQGAAKFELDMVPSQSIGDKIKYTIDGNEAAYYGGMARALKTVENRLTAEDGTINPEAKRYLDSLRASNTQKLYNYAAEQKADKLTGDDRAKKRSKFIDYNTVTSGVDQIKGASSTVLSDVQALKEWARNNAAIGSVIPMDESGTVFGIWTGSRFLKAQEMGLN